MDRILSIGCSCPPHLDSRRHYFHHAVVTGDDPIGEPSRPWRRFQRPQWLLTEKKGANVYAEPRQVRSVFWQCAFAMQQVQEIRSPVRVTSEHQVNEHGGYSMMHERIRWQCAACGSDIADSQGWLSIIRSHVAEAEKANEGFERKAQNPRIGFPAVRLRNIMPQPGIAEWTAYHHRCDPAHDDALWVINVENLRSREQLLWWTLHFMDTKSWIEHTDWTRTVRLKVQFDKEHYPEPE